VTDAVRQFEQAEQRLFARCGVAPTTRWIRLGKPCLRVRVLECGEGPPVLLVGGDGAVAAAWGPLMAQLPGRRVIVLDRPGFGLSDAFDYRGVDLRAHGVALLRSLLDALGLGAVAIVGSSGGGQWSLWLALDAPERVSALAPMGMPAACLPGFRPDAGMRALSLPGLGRLMFALPSPSPEVTAKMLSGADARLPEHPEIVDVYHAGRRLPGYGGAAAAIFRASMRIGGAPRRALPDADLARITQPVLFVWGDSEPYGPPAVAHRAAAVMPDARVEVVAGGWHHPWLADPPGVGRLVLGFLAGHDA
jgi:pimeloyl-ACP methyl ester carboxylesterase